MKNPPNPISAYHWRDVANFGDRLSPVLLEHFVGREITWASPSEAEVLSTGSVLDLLPETGWGGIIAGSGKLLSETSLDLTSATVLGLRGPLTMRDMSISASDRMNLVLGDPGLLVNEVVTVERDKYPLGCVPHCTDTELFPREVNRARRDHYVEPILIDPGEDPLKVIAMIGSCSKIISSSLHGIITADAYGIPRRAEKFAAMASNPREGGRLKWDDYGKSIKSSIEFGTLQEPARHPIENVQYALFDMFIELARIIHAV